MGLGQDDPGLGLVQRRLVGAGVDLEERLALLHVAAFAEATAHFLALLIDTEDLVEPAGHPRRP